MPGKYLYACMLPILLLTTLKVNPALCAGSCDVFKTKDIEYQPSAEDESVLDVTLTFDINKSCTSETLTQARVMIQQQPVCQILQPLTHCLASGSCRCDKNGRLYSVTMTRKVKVGHSESWLLVGEYEGKRSQETVVVVDTRNYVVNTDALKPAGPIDGVTSSGFAEFPGSNSESPEVIPEVLKRHQPEMKTPRTKQPVTASSTLATVLGVSKSSPAPSPSSDLQQFGYIIIGVIGGFCFLLVLCFGILFFVMMWRKKEKAKSKDEVLATAPIPCTSRRPTFEDIHTALELLSVQRPLPSASRFDRLDSTYTPLGEVEHTYQEIGKGGNRSSYISVKSSPYTLPKSSGDGPGNCKPPPLPKREGGDAPVVVNEEEKKEEEKEEKKEASDDYLTPIEPEKAAQEEVKFALFV